MFPLSTALLGFNCFVDEAWPATDVVVTRDLPYGSNFNNVTGEVQAAFVDAADVGTCYVNWCNDVHAQIVWSGVGLSGNGNGAMGFEGFRVLTNPKSVLKRAKPMVFPPSSL